jgi:endoglucanase
VTLGLDGDGLGNCTMTFTQPTTAGRTAPTDLNLWRTPQPQNSITGQGAAFDTYKMVPTFIWQGDWSRRPRTEVAGWAASAKAAGKVLPVTLYAFPRSGYSAGGLNSLGEYQAWVDEVSAGIGSTRAIVIVEPDALYLANRMQDGTTAQVAISYAVKKLKSSNPNTKVYLESSYWFDSALQSQWLRAAGVAQTAGFVMNVSSFETTTKVATIAEAVTRDLARHGVSGKKYLIDTGRNGNGPLTAAFGPGGEPWLVRHLEWLNPPGRGLGLSPRLMSNPAFPNFAAAVWVKPPGATDGQDPGTTWHAPYFGEPAPADGQFWLAWMHDALKHTDMVNLQ